MNWKEVDQNYEFKTKKLKISQQKHFDYFGLGNQILFFTWLNFKQKIDFFYCSVV